LKRFELQRLQRLDQDDSSGLTDSLLLLDERVAVNQVLDGLNRRKLHHQLWFFAALSFVFAILSLSKGIFWLVCVAVAMLLINLALIRFREIHLVTDHVRPVISAVLIGHLILLQLFHLDGSALPWFFFFALMAARFRFSTGEHVALLAAMYAVQVARAIIESLAYNEAVPLFSLTLYLVFYLPCFVLGWWLTHQRTRRFLIRWRTETGRHRDRLRMKRELENARQIQLSMLPRQAPNVGWLDIAALSLPATEVGGDYYDYFQLDQDRLAVILGDVTGHGVASGLVLSGVRSSLNLLQDELAEPGKILRRLNRMLKKTTTRHMLMTLGVVVFDQQEQLATVATAGHPPVLKMSRRNGQVSEAGYGSLPLGALHVAEYREKRVALEPGDVLLIFSDGLVETLSSQQEQYGWQRLHEVFASQVLALSAKEIRDAILRDVWSHKAEAEQVDDVTMVVVRVRSTAHSSSSSVAGSP
jgi:hypothetical protein